MIELICIITNQHVKLIISFSYTKTHQHFRIYMHSLVLITLRHNHHPQFTFDITHFMPSAIRDVRFHSSPLCYSKSQLCVILFEKLFSLLDINPNNLFLQKSKYISIFHRIVLLLSKYRVAMTQIKRSLSFSSQKRTVSIWKFITHQKYELIYFAKLLCTRC